MSFIGFTMSTKVSLMVSFRLFSLACFLTPQVPNSDHCCGFEVRDSAIQLVFVSVFLITPCLLQQQQKGIFFLSTVVQVISSVRVPSIALFTNTRERGRWVVAIVGSLS